MTMTRKQAIQILSTRDWSGMLCGYTSGYTKAIMQYVQNVVAQVERNLMALNEYQELQPIVLIVG